MRTNRKLLAVLVFGLTLSWSVVALADDKSNKDESEDNEWKKTRDKYDKDKDGKLSEDERKAMMKDRRDAILKKYDKNKNGRLDLKERKKWASDQRKQIFKRLDTNKDKKITAKEAEKAKGRRGRRLNRGFDRIDSDGDGAISIDEMEAMLVRRPLPGNRRSRRGGRGGRGFRPTM